MNIICKLTDKDFGIEPIEMNNCRLRLASRGIVIRNDGKIALQNKVKKNEFKLVGGGIENNEDPKLAFKREVLEEAGCEVEIIKELGTTEEYRGLENLKQISHIFTSKVINDRQILNLTEKEKSEGAKLIWVEPKEALKLVTDCYDKLLASDYESVYATRFVALRDRKILEYYLENK
ncbi:MAG: NUDIX domain-containing protein [Clostridia bacterium]|nr:NUDIX domain-containing protein [Clostridia bacterium]